MAGLGKLLSNPLIAGVLATDLIGSTEKAYQAAENAPNPDDQRFVNRALASGRPVTNIEPRGLFSRFMGPTNANPDQIAMEQLALQQQKAQQLGQVETGAELANKIGHGNYNVLMKTYGGGLMPELPYPTPSELKKNNDTAVELFPVDPKSGLPEKTETRTQMISEGGPPSGYSAMKPPKPPQDVYENAVKRGLAAVDVIDKIDETRPLESRNIVRKSSFYDPFTGRKITNKDAQTAKIAHDKGYVDISDKDAPQFEAMTKSLGSLREFIAPNGPADKIFVKTKGMNRIAAQNAILKNKINVQGAEIPSWIPVVGGSHIFGLKNIDPEVQDYYSQMLNEIQGLYSLQHRYAAGSEFKLLPDLMPSLDQSYEVNKQRVQNLVGRFGNDISKGLQDSRTEDTESSVVDAVSSAFAHESDETDNVINGSDSRGELVIPPPPEGDRDSDRNDESGE